MSNKRTLVIARKLATLAGWLGVAVCFVIVLSASMGKHRMHSCQKVEVKVDTDKGLFFVNEEDVRRTFKDLCGDVIEGTPIQQIDLGLLENSLLKNPFVEHAEIYAGMNGVLNVKIRQKEPLVRVINTDGVSFYITKTGQKMPVSDNFTPRVLVATGHVGVHGVENDGQKDSTILANLHKLAVFIDGDEFWNAMVEQIHVDERGEFELIPMLGSHNILLGTADDLEGKFRRLRIFYKEVLKNVDEEKYRTVNVQFKDQIICTKYF